LVVVGFVAGVDGCAVGAAGFGSTPGTGIIIIFSKSGFFPRRSKRFFSCAVSRECPAHERGFGEEGARTES
jgi:hypothetical protein